MANRAALALAALPLLLSASTRLGSQSTAGGITPIASPAGAGSAQPQLKPIRLDDTSALGRVDAALLSDGSAMATWIEFADGKAQFRMRRVTPSGERGQATTVAGLSANRASGYPRMARFADELIFAWTESGTPSTVKTARMSVSSGTATSR